MKKIACLVHDPGGYSAIYPVVEYLAEKDFEIDFYCTGSSAAINPQFAYEEKLALAKLSEKICSNEIDLLLTGTSWGNSLELQTSALCKKHGIITVAVLDYWSNYKLRFVDELGNLHYPDYFVVMDELAKQESIKEGISEKIIEVLGQPGFDRYINSSYSTREGGADDSILFLSQPLSSLFGDSLGYTECNVLEDCIRLGREAGFAIDVKFHPKDNALFVGKYAKLAVEGDLWDILPRYKVVTGMSTAGLLYSVMLGNKTISYQPNLQGKDFCITNKLGLTKLITSYECLLSAVSDSKQLAASFDKKQLAKYIWSDGQSTFRTGEFIINLLNKKCVGGN